jgi:hypothetical protein
MGGSHPVMGLAIRERLGTRAWLGPEQGQSGDNGCHDATPTHELPRSRLGAAFP